MKKNIYCLSKRVVYVLTLCLLLLGFPRCAQLELRAPHQNAQQ